MGNGGGGGPLHEVAEEMEVEMEEQEQDYEIEYMPPRAIRECLLCLSTFWHPRIAELVDSCHWTWTTAWLDTTLDTAD